MHKNLFIISFFLIIISITFIGPATAGENISKQFQAKSYPGSRDRDYIVHLPDGYDGSKPVPLVMVLHGCSQNHQTIQNDTNFDAIADREGFAVVYPFITSYEGFRNTNCWGFWFDEEIHEGAGEVQDLGSIIEEIQTDYTIDANRIHVTGLSSGAAMAIDVMVAHSEIIASGSETAGLPYSETSSSVGFSCGNPGRFKSTSAVANAMNREMADELRPVPLFIVHSRDDCTVNIQAAENVRDSWGQLFGVDTRTPAASESGTTLGTPWTHNKYIDGEGRSFIETLFISGKNHGWYGGRDGQFAFKDAPNTAQIMWDFFKANPLNNNELPEVRIAQVAVDENSCISVTGSASDKDGTVVAVNVAFEGLFPQPPQPADLAGSNFTYTKCQLRNNASYTPFVEVVDNAGGTASVRGQAVVIGELPPNTPPVLTLGKEGSEGACAVLEGTATDDKKVSSVEVKLGDQLWSPATIDSTRWTARVCNLQPGSYQTQIRATDAEKLTTTISGKGIVIVAGFDAVESANLTGHLIAQRVRNYGSGFGAADKSYLGLLNEHGVSQEFQLYESQGNWYTNVDNIPITSGLKQTLSSAEIASQDSCITMFSSNSDLSTAENLLLEYRIGDNPWQFMSTDQPGFDQKTSLLAEQCGLDDGLHAVELRASNSTGQISQLSGFSQRIGVNQPPEISIKENQLIDDCIVISGEAQDDAQVKQVIVSLDGAHWENAALSGDSWYFDHCGLVQKPEQLWVRAIDGWDRFDEKIIR